MKLRLLPPASGRGIGLARRIAWIASCIGFLAICLGCLSIGGRTEVVNRDDRSSTQSGKATIGAKREMDVYYPVPYAQTPNLELETSGDDCVIVEQKADHFRVKSTSHLTRSVSWTARGVSSLASPAPPVQADNAKTSAPEILTPFVTTKPLSASIAAP